MQNSLRLLSVLLALLLARAGDVEGNLGGSFNSDEWVSTRTLSVDLGGNIGEAKAILLKSRLPSGQSGIGEPLFSALLMITAGERLLYRFEPSDRNESFFIDDFLQARDVTGDGQPEFLFHSGNVGASSSVVLQHVIYWQGVEGGFRDIAPRQFMETRRQTFRWVEHGRRMIALVAEPIVPASAIDPHSCNGCPHFYQYLAFAWRDDRGAFVLLGAIQSERDHADGVDPLSADKDLIESRLLNSVVPPQRLTPRG